MHRLPLVAIRALLLLSAVACGSGGTGTATTTPASSAPPSLGPPLQLTGFSVATPAGWTRTTDATAIARVSSDGTNQILLVTPPQSGGIEATIRVVVVRDGPVPTGQVVAYLQSVSQHGATHLSSPVARTVDGEAATQITYDHSVGSSTAHSADLLVTHHSITYDVAVDGAAGDFPTDNAAFIALLGSWHWST